jgi:RNA polymerase sigma-70 factor (ECF subfamily)
LEKYDDEPDLVARSREGDLAAFNTLVERYQRPLYNLCLRMLASPEAAEDATQEAFIHAFRSIRTFRGGSLKSWLFRIGANGCYDEIAVAGRGRRCPWTSLTGRTSAALTCRTPHRPRTSARSTGSWPRRCRTRSPACRRTSAWR